MSSDTTAVYVHESRFPLRILKHLAKAGPPGVGTQVKRLDALFRYEANVKERPSQDSAAQLAPPSSRQVATSDGASSREKGKAKQTALEESTTVRTRHDDDPYRRSLLDNGDAHTSEILTFESPIEGLVTQWCLPEGQLLINPK